MTVQELTFSGICSRMAFADHHPATLVSSEGRPYFHL